MDLSELTYKMSKLQKFEGVQDPMPFKIKKQTPTKIISTLEIYVGKDNKKVLVAIRDFFPNQEIKLHKEGGKESLKDFKVYTIIFKTYPNPKIA